MNSQNVVFRGAALANAHWVLVLLHGRGATAQNMLGLADIFADAHCCVAAPQASQNSWYPYSFMAEDARNEPWLSQSIAQVKRLIDQISEHLSLERIVIMGFSQGACLALEVASRHASKYAGIVAFTGGLIGQKLQEEKYQGNFRGTQVFIGNSDRDPHVPLIRSEQSKQMMDKLGARVTLKVYPGMGHTMNEDEMEWVNSHIITPCHNLDGSL